MAPRTRSWLSRAGGTRTPNRRFWRPVLYQLSYCPPGQRGPGHQDSSGNQRHPGRAGAKLEPCHRRTGASNAFAASTPIVRSRPSKTASRRTTPRRSKPHSPIWRPIRPDSEPATRSNACSGVLRGQDLDITARRRVCALALRAVDVGFHGPTREYRWVVRKHATNQLRRELRARLHSLDPGVSWRALLLLVAVRHPGLSRADVTTARDVIRIHVGEAQHGWIDAGLLDRFWSDEWATDLHARARDERELGARRLLEQARQRDRFREWRASKRRQSATPSTEARSEDES